MDFETGQLINEINIEYEYLMTCCYDFKSNLCFYDGCYSIFAIDMRMSPKNQVIEWYYEIEEYGDVGSIKYHDNKLYCGSKTGTKPFLNFESAKGLFIPGVPVVFDMRSTEPIKDSASFAYEKRNMAKLHVDHGRVLIGTEKEMFCYGREQLYPHDRIEISINKPVVNYSWQDSYIIVDTKTSTELYSVADRFR